MTLRLAGTLLAAGLSLLPSAAVAASCRDGIQAAPGRFCQTVDDCRAFCSCACSFDPHGWTKDEKDDTSTSCPGLPRSGPGIIAADSADLQPLPDDYRYIVHEPGVRATEQALAGLRRLDARLAASKDREKWGYKVLVGSCWRSHLGDTVRECGYVLKSKYMLDKENPVHGRAYWEDKSNPLNLGLAWPGATPHSAGLACDLILLDKRGRRSFDSRAGIVYPDGSGPPTSSIPARQAVRMLDAEVTSDEVGARRLTYEAWHYEWGTSEFGSGSLCKGGECARFWPITGVPPKN